MNVYVVQEEHTRDGYVDDVLGVFSDEQKAEDYANKMHAKLGDGYTVVNVIAFELDGEAG